MTIKYGGQWYDRTCLFAAKEYVMWLYTSYFFAFLLLLNNIISRIRNIIEDNIFKDKNKNSTTSPVYYVNSELGGIKDITITNF